MSFSRKVAIMLKKSFLSEFFFLFLLEWIEMFEFFVDVSFSLIFRKYVDPILLHIEVICFIKFRLET